MTVFSIIPGHSGGVYASQGLTAATSSLVGLWYTGDLATDLNLLFDSIGDEFQLTGHSDRLEGGSGGDSFFQSTVTFGGAGDYLSGGAGDDYFESGDNPDTIDGGSGIDTLSYELSGDAVVVNLLTESTVGSGQFSDAFLDRISGIERVYGSAFGDTLIGNDGYNYLDGGAGDDILTGGLGNNLLSGGSGNDLFILGAGADAIFDSAGIDTVRFTNASTINFQSGYGLGDPSNDNWNESFIERFEGSGGDDTIILTVAAYGDKELWGLGGNDILGGNADQDDMHGGNGNDYLYGRDGFDLLDGGSGSDALYGDADWDTLIGGYGNDTLDGGSGFDRADFSDHFGNSSLGWNINLVTGRATTQDFLGGVFFRTETDRLVSIEAIIGSSGNDVVYDNGKNNLIDGGAGQDTVYLAAKVAVNIGGIVFNFASDDVVDMTLGNVTGANGQSLEFTGIEIIHANIGNDTVTGTVNGDIIHGDAGSDTLYGGQGADLLYGGTQADRLEGGADADILYGGDGADALIGGDGIGIDVASYDDANYGDLYISLIRPQDNTGAAHGDTYVGIEGLTGGVGHDTLVGNKFSNQLSGGAGNDTVTGGAGVDILAGGGGADSFVFTIAASALHADFIQDFEHGIDHMQLLQTRFAALGATVDAGEFTVGTAANDADDFIIYDQGTGFVYFDADGNGAGVMRKFAAVDFGTTLTFDDFVMA